MSEIVKEWAKEEEDEAEARLMKGKLVAFDERFFINSLPNSVKTFGVNCSFLATKSFSINCSFSWPQSVGAMLGMVSSLFMNKLSTLTNPLFS